MLHDMPHEVSPKDRFITVYGRKPVLEALADPALRVAKVVLADTVRGQGERRVLAAADRRDVPVSRVSAHRVKVLAGNGKQDQGVAADVVATRMRPLAAALDERPPSVLLLDGVTTPANVGMILRSATAAGIDGIVLPRRGVAGIDPLVIKASAGVAFHAPVLRAGSAGAAAEELRRAGYRLLGLASNGAESLFDSPLPLPGAYVLGGENAGIGEQVRGLLDGWLSVPLAAGVESLNVSAAAAILCFELRRRAPIAPIRSIG
jgi:23S rRNA (guanosine2251-2'-O)-methyltransferase